MLCFDSAAVLHYWKDQTDATLNDYIARWFRNSTGRKGGRRNKKNGDSKKDKESQNSGGGDVDALDNPEGSSAGDNTNDANFTANSEQSDSI